MIKSNIFYIVIILLNATFCCCQNSNQRIDKIEIDHDLNFYYSDSEGHFIMQNKDSINKLIYKMKTNKYPFFDVSPNSNFIVKDSFLISLRIEKNGLFCKNENEFKLIPWETFLECRNIYKKVKLPKAVIFVPSLTPLNVENLASFFYSKNYIHFDFIHYKENVLMLILVDNTLHVYNNIDAISNNKWKLKKSFSSSMQLPFISYINSSNNIILEFNSDNIFHVDLTQDNLNKVREKPILNRCLVYDHRSKEYLWITKKEADLLLKSKDPASIINSKLKSNDN